MKEYVICVCFALLFCTGVKIVMPGKGYGGIIRIVCGVFVVSTIVSPIVRITGSDIASFDFGTFFDDDGSFSHLVDKSKADFESQMTDRAGEHSREVLEQELSYVFDSQITVKKRGGVWVIKGADLQDEEKIADYVRAHYGLNTEFD